MANPNLTVGTPNSGRIEGRGRKVNEPLLLGELRDRVYLENV